MKSIPKDLRLLSINIEELRERERERELRIKIK
jgi:hypothetical protein